MKPSALRFRKKASVFSEVGIESKRAADMQTLHDYKARTISEAELMICEILEDAPGGLADFRGHMLDAEQAARAQIFAKLDRHGMPCPKADDRIAFVQNIIARDESLTRRQAGVPEANSLHMVGIAPILQGEESRGVYKNHFADGPYKYRSWCSAKSAGPSKEPCLWERGSV